ncbi:hypothetical protein PROFUN_16597 [Planoprotostelium fungivorum]|uniref:Uncharacterized protein n=1 Tax=Planoprotostelium fungivorum TaxID=1890364 RepID=A0A2P6MPG7_9EUKA|nr:hypothetical protein PROFUN_16597 [Planoprotostelium fungivorum]
MKRNATLKAHPQTLISLCLYEAQATIFYLYKACSEHKKAYKCFAENLQTDHRKQAFMKTQQQRLLSFSLQCFPPSLYRACSEHTKAYKCFAENL